MVFYVHAPVYLNALDTYGKQIIRRGQIVYHELPICGSRSTGKDSNGLMFAGGTHWDVTCPKCLKIQAKEGGWCEFEDVPCDDCKGDVKP